MPSETKSQGANSRLLKDLVMDKQSLQPSKSCSQPMRCQRRRNTAGTSLAVIPCHELSQLPADVGDRGSIRQPPPIIYSRLDTS